MPDRAAPAAAAQADAPKPTFNQRLAKWVPIAAGVIAALIGAAKLSETFTLPSCESSRSLGAIKAIFKDKNIPEPTLTDPKGMTSTSSEKTCEASYEIPNEKGTLDYRVFWDGWEAKVMITKVTN
jgi:hypothetical protein